MHEIPAGAPATLMEAFAHISQLDSPSVEDLKLMVMLEAAGPALYEGLAAGTDREDIIAILRHNGREELAHAHRVSKAIGVLTGTDYPVPAPEENPYLTGPAPDPEPLTIEKLEGLAEAERSGDDLYARWAANCPNSEVAEIFRQNGREELQHGGRLMEAVKLMAA